MPRAEMVPAAEPFLAHPCRHAVIESCGVRVMVVNGVGLPVVLATRRIRANRVQTVPTLVHGCFRHLQHLQYGCRGVPEPPNGRDSAVAGVGRCMCERPLIRESPPFGGSCRGDALVPGLTPWATAETPPVGGSQNRIEP